MSVDIKKALGTTQAGTVLVDKEIDKTIQQLVEYKNPIRVNMPRKTGSGPGWYVNRRAAGSTPAMFVNDTDTITEDTGTYTRTSFPYKTIATQGRVTRFMQAIGRSYTDVLADEIEAKARDFRDYEEWALLKGRITTSGSLTGNAKHFDGLDVLIPSTQAVVMTSSGLGASLTLAKMDESIDKCAGEPDMIIMSKRSRRALVALLQASQRFVNTVETRGGFILISYNNIPVYVSTRINNNQAFNGTAVTAETGGTTTTVYFLDTEYVWLGELTPITIMPLAKVSSQYDLFDIFCDEVLVMANYLYCSKLIGIVE